MPILYLFVVTEKYTLQASKKLNIKLCEKNRRFRIGEKHVMNSLKEICQALILLQSPDKKD